MKRLALVCVVAAVGCTSVNKKLNTQNRALFDSPAKATAYPEGTPGAGMALTPGQWAKYAIRYKDVWSVQTVSVVGAEGGSVWVEIETVDPKADKTPSWVKVQLRGYDAGNPESLRSMEIGETYTLDARDGQATKAVLPFGNPWSFVVDNMKLILSEGSSDAATAPAGRFPGCNKVDGKFELFGFSSESEVWFHSAVPVWGYVVQRSKDGDYESRLLEFGLEGAESVVDHENAIKPLG